MAASILSFRALSDMMSRVSFAVRAGLTYGGERDLYEALGFKRELRPGDYRDRYRRGGIAARVVDSYPSATWRGGAELIEEDDPNISTEFEEVWATLAQRLQVWPEISRADVLAGLGRFAGILIGAPGDLTLEIPKLNSSADVLFLQSYGEEELTIDKLEDKTDSERYGKPLVYKLKRKSGGRSIDKFVHWSRILHIADNVLDDKVYGSPRLERVWNDIDNLEKVSGGGSEAFWRLVNQGLYFNVDPETVLGSDAAEEQRTIEAMRDRAEEFAHGMTRTMALRGAKVTSLGSATPDFASQVASIVSLISGATGIPQRILLGSERGELASTQDKENWNTRVSDRRRDYGEPIVREFVNRLMTYGALPQVDSYQIRWPDLASVSTMERADAAGKVADLNNKAGGTVILPEEIRDIYLGLDKLDESETTAPTVTLNASQITSAQQIIESVATGKTPRDSGKGQLMVLFNFTEAQAEMLLGSSGEDEPVAAPPTNVEGENRDPFSQVTLRKAARKTRSNEWKAVRKVADSAKKRYAGFVVDARAAINRALAKDSLLDALHQHSRAKAELVVNAALNKAANALKNRAESLVLDTMVAAGNAAARGLRRARPRAASAPSGVPPLPAVLSRPAVNWRVLGGAVGVSFDRRNPRAVAWARDNAANLVQQVTMETREAVRGVIFDAFNRGTAPRVTARAIETVVGLDARRAQAAAGLRQRILDNPGGKVYAGKTAIRVPQDVSEDFLDRKVSEYSERLLRERAETIARTETILAANEGQVEFWAQAVNQGLLDPKQDEREWIATEDDRTCPICDDLDGKRAELDGVFDSSEIGPVDSPPAHPNCRCAQGIVAKEDRPIEEDKPGPNLPSTQEDLQRDQREPFAFVDSFDTRERALEDENRDVAGAIKAYTETSNDVNQLLREGAESIEDEEYRRFVQNEIASLDEAFDKYSSKLDEPRAVYRGISLDAVKEIGFEPGLVIEDKGFTSVSLSPLTALGFSGSGGVILRIIADKGTEFITGAISETELIFKRGGKYEIVGKEKEKVSIGSRQPATVWVVRKIK